MKLLYITRKIDRQDALAGFSYQWVKKIARLVDQLDVICLERGDISDLPANCQVYSLGKECGKNRWREFWRFQLLAGKIVPHIDGVWTHQNPEYAILIAPWARLFQKKLISWYAHGAVSWKVRLMERLVNVVATSSAEGFRLASKKMLVLHQGIDTELFSFKPKTPGQLFTLVTVGRTTPSKNLEWLIDLVKDLHQLGYPQVRLRLVGQTSRPGDDQYLRGLEQKIKQEGLADFVEFIAAVPNIELPAVYSGADLFVNCSRTGSLDKVVLEAMACGTIVITTNTAYRNFFHNINENLFAESYADLLNKAEIILQLSAEDRLLLQSKLRELIVNEHNIDALITKVVQQYKQL
ncbi:MAG: glycosyltransferase family 4 protein [Candidatus Komeilibacteria bacterium]